jgi:hypothetical protein
MFEKLGKWIRKDWDAGRAGEAIDRRTSQGIRAGRTRKAAHADAHRRGARAKKSVEHRSSTLGQEERARRSKEKR